MRANIILSLAAVFIAFASGQTPVPNLDSVFRFTSPAAVQDLEQIRIGFRSLAMIREMSTGPGSESLTLRGTPEQIALAGWLFPQLDRSEPRSAEYRMPGGDDVVRVFHLANVPTSQDLQEISTSVRTMDLLQMMFALSTTKTIVVRGTASQVSFAEWLINAVDKPASGLTDLSAPQDYQVAPGGNDMARVFYLPNAVTPPVLREIAVLIRVSAHFTQLFIYNPLRAIGVRGTAGQIATAEGLVKERMSRK